jgi:ATP-dependent HslUV protease subunit HslV
MLLKKFFTSQPIWRHTTILALKTNNQTTLIADGQVSLGPTIVKTNAIKIRELPNSTFVGFAGSVADAFYLL